MQISGPNQLAALLRKASEAHHAFEATQGYSDPNWSDWYAVWIDEQLTHHASQWEVCPGHTAPTCYAMPDKHGDL